MTAEGFDEAIPRVVPAAQELANQGANVISVFGSSLTFYKGAKFHDELIKQVSEATGRPATTQSNGLLDGLRTANARRVALATAYTDVVTERLKIFLQEHGFEVTSTKGLGLASRQSRRTRPRTTSCSSWGLMPTPARRWRTRWLCPAARSRRSI